MRGKIEEVEFQFKANIGALKEVEELSEFSIKQSNGYLERVSQKLADKEQRKQVSDLERLVIYGACINTTSNFRVGLLFAKVQRDLSHADELLNFIDVVVQNTAKISKT